MRVIIFVTLAALIGCADGSVVPEDATGGAGGQAAATGGSGGHLAMMTGTGGAPATDGGADADPPADAGADHVAGPCDGIPRGMMAGPDVCRNPNGGISCVNLQSDYSNCGACFHVCGGANLAACQDGVCQ